MDVVVGLDCGTTSTKAVAAGTDGVVRTVTRAGYALQVPSAGRAELDPVRLQQAAAEALRAMGEQLRGDRVVAVCVSSAMHGLVPMEADGRPLGPLLTWADARAGADADRLHADGLAAGLHARTGTPVHAMSPLAKLVHHRRTGLTAPRWAGVKEVVLGVLVPGSRQLDLSAASSSGLYDCAGRTWDAEALELADVRPDQLGEVVPTTHVVGGLADGLGLPPGTPVVVGATDGPLANLGVGAVGPGVGAVSLGTSGALRAVQDAFGVDDEGRLFCYALTDDRWVLGGAVNNGGSAVRWASGATTDRDADDATDRALLEEAAAVAPLADGLLCLPYLLGERAPWWRSGLTGAYLGLRRDHGRGHLVRAAVEGVCQQLALVRDSLPPGLTQVRATGGAVTSRLWLEVLAGALDLPVLVADSPEGSGLGACLLGWHAVGGLPDLDDAAGLVRVEDEVRADPDLAARYRRARPLVEQAALAVAALDLTLLEAR